LLAAAAFLTLLSALMLGPLLVTLAHAFQTSVALVGQLAAATAITWGLTAPLAGPIADAYGRRPMLLTGLLLMAVGLLGAALAWNYGTLLACRLLTGVGAALIPSNSLAMLADVFPPAERGKAIGWVLSATGVGAVVGVPVVACLLDAGGWHLPFSVLGTASLVLWILFWVWLPRSPLPPDQPLAFFSHYREVGANGTFWSVLTVGALQQMVFFGMFAYLAAHLMQTYHLPPRETALPLALAGGGVIVGAFLGGRVADHRRRLVLFALSCVGSGVLAALVFTTRVSPWATVGLAFGAASLARISTAVTPTLLLELAGRSRTTATGLGAVGSQMGVFGGSALGGLLLALGGFPMVGLLCLGGAVLAAGLLRLTVRDSDEFLAQLALRQGKTATES
jgi:predicted MFS family arabinose efflux permease